MEEQAVLEEQIQSGTSILHDNVYMTCIHDNVYV